jgi:hypothetical protein
MSLIKFKKCIQKEITSKLIIGMVTYCTYGLFRICPSIYNAEIKHYNMQKDYRFVWCFLSVWELFYTKGTTLTEGVSGTGRRSKYQGTRRKEQTEVRETCKGTFTSSYVLNEQLLEWSGWLGCSDRCVRWNACGNGKCIPGLDGSAWRKESICIHTRIYIHRHIHTYVW